MRHGPSCPAPRRSTPVSSKWATGAEVSMARIDDSEGPRDALTDLTIETIVPSLIDPPTRAVMSSAIRLKGMS